MTEEKRKSVFASGVLLWLLATGLLLIWVGSTPIGCLNVIAAEHGEFTKAVGPELAGQWRDFMIRTWVLDAHEIALQADEQLLELGGALKGVDVEELEKLPWKFYLWGLICAERLGQVLLGLVLSFPAWIVAWQLARCGAHIRRNDLQGELPVMMKHKRGICLTLMLCLLLTLAAPVRISMALLLGAVGAWGMMVVALAVAVRESNRT